MSGDLGWVFGEAEREGALASLSVSLSEVRDQGPGVGDCVARRTAARQASGKADSGASQSPLRLGAGRERVS